MKLTSFTLIGLLLACPVFAQDQDEPREPQKMALPLPVLVVGGAVAATFAWKVTKSAAGLVGLALRNPIIAGATGIFIAAPTLKKTLFAENPETSIKKLSDDIALEWQNNLKNARENLHTLNTYAHDTSEKFRAEFEKNHPHMYAKLKEMHDDEQVQKILQQTKEGKQQVAAWIQAKKVQLGKWLNTKSDESQK